MCADFELFVNGAQLQHTTMQFHIRLLFCDFLLLLLKQQQMARKNGTRWR